MPANPFLLCLSRLARFRFRSNKKKKLRSALTPTPTPTPKPFFVNRPSPLSLPLSPLSTGDRNDPLPLFSFTASASSLPRSPIKRSPFDGRPPQAQWLGVELRSPTAVVPPPGAVAGGGGGGAGGGGRGRKSRRGPRSRSSQYRGVTFYRRTGRWESHIWDCGKQVYLGGFDTAHAAARAYDRAAMKFRDVNAKNPKSIELG